MQHLTVKQQEKLRLLQREDSRLRGALLSSCALLEAILSDCIATFFCADEKKKMLMYSEVLSGGMLMFRAKINLLAGILSSMDESFSRKNSKLIAGLDDIRVIRNRLAHCHLDSSVEAIDGFRKGHFTIKFYEDGIAKTHTITEDEIQLKLDLVFELKMELLNLLEKIKGA